MRERALRTAALAFGRSDHAALRVMNRRMMPGRRHLRVPDIAAVIQMLRS